MKWVFHARGGWAFGLTVFVIAMAAGPVLAEDWPAYQHDNRRSGISPEQLELPLKEAWRYVAVHPPRPAWPAPAKADLWHHIDPINPMVTYDRAFHVVVAGDMLYFGSSADDKVYALDAATGTLRWEFFTGGPVRLAPAVWDGKVYVASDDGYVYCLDARDGALVWDYTPAPDKRRLIGNGRMISACPIRTGVVVAEGGDRGRATAYFCAGLFPSEGVYLCAVDALDGSEVWTTAPDNLSSQGYLLASPTRLYVPRGRISPCVFERADGRYVCSFAGSGGTYALLDGDAFVCGPGASGELGMFQADQRDRIATFDGLRIIAATDVSYLQRENELTALDRARYLDIEKQRYDVQMRRKERRKKAENRLRDLDPKNDGDEIAKIEAELTAMDREIEERTAALSNCDLWQRAWPDGHALILAGTTLFAGGDGRVAAYHASDGELLWKAEVEGRAYGLAAANGRLFVSTDKGVIHCFAAGGDGPVRTDHAATSSSVYGDNGPANAYASLADRIVEETGVRRGYGLVLGCGDGRLCYELAQRTQLHLIAVESDPKRVAAARRALDAAGLYGERVAIHYRPGSQDRLPYPDYFANLIVSEAGAASGLPSVAADEVLRVLRPCGGAAYVGQAEGSPGRLSRGKLVRWAGKCSNAEWTIDDKQGLWAVLSRGPIEGSGDWTHMYADATNSACSYDERVRGPMQIQWFGRPGPRLMVDRHHQNVAPVYWNGRIFVPADNRVMAIDAYNGALLWNVELPGSRRFAAPQDTCNMVAADDGCLYVAVEDACRVLDGATGRPVRALQVPQLVEGEGRHWGYTAMAGDLLVGSGRKPEAVYNEISWEADDYQWTEFKRMVTSDYLFCLDRATGDQLWTYTDGVIINPAIAVGGETLYFVTSPSPAAAEDPDGKMKLEVLFDGDADLVALDVKTGKPLWKQTADLSAFEQVIFASCAQEVVLLSGSRNIGEWLWHVLHAFDARNGEPLWQQEQNTRWEIGGRHGEQQRHPAIVGDTIYAEPHAYDLHTGAKKEGWSLRRGGGGCGTITASASALFWRGSNPQMYEIAADARTPLNRVSRPGCWINIIPAGGLVLIPESSSGCTCAYPMQTSFAFAPTSDQGPD